MKTVAILLIVILIILVIILAYVFLRLTNYSKKLGKMDYSQDNLWYSNGQKYDENKIDVFYCLSTALLDSVDENGNSLLNACLNDKDRETIDTEYKHMSTKLFDNEHFNFIAPYYRIMTFKTYDIVQKNKSVVKFLGAYKSAMDDLLNAFNYYMKHQNNGRPFIIAGFSQGAMMLRHVVKQMTDEQLSRMIASYMMGYQITKKDMQHKNIKPATGEDDLGVSISYNSVKTVDCMWKGVNNKAATCINPLNWKTDDTPAQLIYDGDKATVHVDQDHHLLVVDGLDSNKYDGMGYPIEKGIYHMWDIRFYADAINKNAIHRSKLFLDKNKD